MEERIIDDEYGRGVRLRKTKDGYVDVTDELENGAETACEDEGEEIAFEFPVFQTDEDDEDLVGLTPEEAAALIKKKEEEAAQRKADYERLCAEGEELLASGSYHAAELKYEKALSLDDEATAASVGYWRAKTSDFQDPDVLIDEYVDAGIESLEYDLGYAAVDTVKRQYRKVFEKRIEALSEEETPLAEKVEEKKEKRRAILSKRVKKTAVGFGVSFLPTAALLVLSIVFGVKNFTTLTSEFVLPTVLCCAGFFVCFIAFLIFTNKFINACRMYFANGKLASTEDGQRLLQIRAYKELYECLLPTETEISAETEDESEEETPAETVANDENAE